MDKVMAEESLLKSGLGNKRSAEMHLVRLNCMRSLRINYEQIMGGVGEYPNSITNN